MCEIVRRMAARDTGRTLRKGEVPAESSYFPNGKCIDPGTQAAKALHRFYTGGSTTGQLQKSGQFKQPPTGFTPVEAMTDPLHSPMLRHKSACSQIGVPWEPRIALGSEVAKACLCRRLRFCNSRLSGSFALPFFVLPLFTRSRSTVLDSCFLGRCHVE
jgi:hypothetical protein